MGRNPDSVNLLTFAGLPRTRVRGLMAGVNHNNIMNEDQDAPASQPTMGTAREMPRYKCHKEVHALKIAKIEFDVDKAKTENRETTGGATITPADEGYAPFDVSFQFVRKHSPEEGGYYVVYADGYTSFSPAKAFEDGYTKLP